jgi:hypothetical protein
MTRYLLLPLLWAIFLLPNVGSACAVCFGAPDSQIAKGVSWSVLALLGIVMIVLGGFVAFFIYIAKRARQMPLLPNSPVTAKQ